MKKTPITSWEQFISLKEGDLLLEIRDKLGDSENYIMGKVSSSRRSREIHYNKKKECFTINRSHFQYVMDVGSTRLYHIVDEHFDDGLIMNYQSDCLCGGECQKPCVAIKQIQEEINSMTNPEFKEATARTIKSLAGTRGIKFFLKYDNGDKLGISKEAVMNLARSKDDFQWIPAEKYGKVVYLLLNR